MRRLLCREFTVEAPVDVAWAHLARVDRWTSWARHIKSAALEPAELGLGTRGVFRLSNGVKSTFAMTEFDPFTSWRWAGPFLWLDVHYDHRFESLGPHLTKLTWILDARGFGVGLLGGLFARIYNRNLDRAIPLLIEELRVAGRGPEEVA